MCLQWNAGKGDQTSPLRKYLPSREVSVNIVGSAAFGANRKSWIIPIGKRYYGTWIVGGKP
jgi:hypothetical protein